MSFRTFVIAWIFGCLISFAPSARADFMLDPTAVSTNMGTFSGNINNVINQAGQNPTYISDVTVEPGNRRHAMPEQSARPDDGRGYRRPGGISWGKVAERGSAGERGVVRGQQREISDWLHWLACTCN